MIAPYQPGNGAVDFKECPQYGSSCRCEPKCKVCGFGKHMAVHGPHYGAGAGSKPYDHEFVADDDVRPAPPTIGDRHD